MVRTDGEDWQTTSANTNETQKKNNTYIYTMYKHFHSDKHHGLRDLEVHLIDKVNEKDNLLAKEGQWAY